MNKCLVSVVRSSYDTVYEKLFCAIDLAGGIKLSSQNKIVIKVNLCDSRTPDTGAITHPIFLDALLKYIREQVSNDVPIYVVESDGRVVIADLFVKWFGLLPVIEKWNAKWLNLSKDECIEKKVHGFKYAFYIPKIFDDAYFITLPKLKTNVLSNITCCLKNQFGCNPRLDKQTLHSSLDKTIVALNLAVGAPDFCIVDGIVGVGGIGGPSFGPPIYSEVIVAGSDAVAVDSVCAKIMGFNPRRIGHIRLAAKKGVGKSHYVVVGERLESVKQDFEWSSSQAFLLKIALRFQSRAFKRKIKDVP
ncbi:MAG: DUF362 domain-containing protein [Candidatus Bathyarchaeota archaeon]|uniref:DUF362 domain-containing protein n=1 Tax=Candidatus Bathycorpusculum sp. TaxID=2994959 RepID=UPI00282C0538|nr:DUF362 domain-containing protein [Candidatus Termiticorpusculum sp.]MCL2256905.1 DUF362 domain-containing protein [Candidatus Termiticorpusculum sp.]MCL2292971.1 DUF362 domain-containing protein [Candidatus Termiticorpusculum sp.]